jgi:hypothetical protein
MKHASAVGPHLPDRAQMSSGSLGRRAATHSASGLEAGLERAVLFDRGNNLLKQGAQILLAAINVLLHAGHKLLEIFFADDLRSGMSAAATGSRACAGCTLLG